jgi:hypothetical protein
MNLRSEGAKAKGLVFGTGYGRGYTLDECCGGVLLLRAATATGAKALALGVLNCPEEDGVASEWTASGASGSAINLRGAHSEEEGAIGARIPVNGSLPIAFRSLRRDGTGGRFWEFVFHGPRLAWPAESSYPISDGKLSTGSSQLSLIFETSPEVREGYHDRVFHFKTLGIFSTG